MGNRKIEMYQYRQATHRMRPVHQLVAAPAVVAGDDRLCLKPLAVSRLYQHRVGLRKGPPQLFGL